MKTVNGKVTVAEYFLSEKKEVEFAVWTAGALLGFFTAAVLLLIYYRPSVFAYMTYDCFVRTYSGIICPGCGGTRAFFTFLQGRFVASFCYHPVVPYMGIIYIVFMFRGLLHFFSKGNYSFMKFRMMYIYIGIAITILQFLVKNICLFVFHVTWL